MSLSRRAFILSALAVAACGFTPVYGPGGVGQKLFGKVRAADPRNPDEYFFSGFIEQRIGRPTAPVYDLAYNVRVAVVPQAITSDEVTTRYALNGTASFTLTEIATSRVVTRGQVSSFTSYSATGTSIATMTAEQDAHERLAEMLADQVVTRLLATTPDSLP